MKELIEYPGYYLSEAGELFRYNKGKYSHIQHAKNIKHKRCGVIKYKTTISVWKEMCKLYFDDYNDEMVLHIDGDKHNCSTVNMILINDTNNSKIEDMVTRYNDDVRCKRIPGFVGYYIGKNGKVFSINKGYIYEVAVYKNPRGYNRVKFSDCKHYEVHKLMGITFLEAENKIVHHMDSNKLNNELSNLIALTEEEHEAQHLDNKRSLTIEQAEEIRSIYVPGDRKYGQNALAKLYGVSSTTIYRIVNGKRY